MFTQDGYLRNRCFDNQEAYNAESSGSSTYTTLPITTSPLNIPTHSTKGQRLPSSTSSSILVSFWLFQECEVADTFRTDPTIYDAENGEPQTQVWTLNNGALRAASHLLKTKARPWEQVSVTAR